jgi:nicotinamide riboside kinase
LARSWAESTASSEWLRRQAQVAAQSFDQRVAANMLERAMGNFVALDSQTHFVERPHAVAQVVKKW